MLEEISIIPLQIGTWFGYDFIIIRHYSTMCSAGC